MKKSSLITLVFFSTVLYFLFTSSSNGRATAANSGNTGAPGESQVCGNCHSGGGFGPVNVSIQVFQPGTTTPAPGYIPGQQYDIRVTVQNTNGNPGGYGFQLTCLTTIGNNPLSGYTNLASNVKQKLVTTGAFNGRTYVEHNGVLANNQFNFSWTAPSAGTGNVTFYSAGNAVNATGSTGGDNGGSTSLVFPEIQSLSASGTITNNACANEAEGAIDVVVNGGLPPIQYLWSDGAISQDRTGLPSGSYSVDISDAAGQSANVEFTITAPQAVIIELDVQDALSLGANGSFSFDVLSGNEPIAIEITPSVDPLNAPVGEYTIIATDAEGCSFAFPFVITGPEDISVQSQVQHISCFGLNDGSLELDITGGVPPYSLLWNDGISEEDRTNLGPGIYSVSITDNTGYNKSIDFEILEPEPLDASVNMGSILCAGGTTEVVIEATGGTAPYSGVGTFSFSAGAQNLSIIDNNGCEVTLNIDLFEPSPFIVEAFADPISCTGQSGLITFTAQGGSLPYQNFQETAIINNPGFYAFNFLDFNGCEAAVNVEVAALDGFTVSAVQEDVSCNGLCDGVVTLFSPDATSNVTFEWPNDAIASSRNDLCAGTYNIFASDENGCIISTLITVNEPSALTYEILTIVEEGEDIGLIEIQAQGGTAPYSYTWSTGAFGNAAVIPVNENHQVTITDANACELISEDFFIVLGINEKEFDIKIYPIPADEMLNIQTERSFGSLNIVRIRDLQGKIVHAITTNEWPIQMNVSHLYPGQYILEIGSGNQWYRKNIAIR